MIMSIITNEISNDSISSKVRQLEDRQTDITDMRNT